WLLAGDAGGGGRRGVYDVVVEVKARQRGDVLTLTPKRRSSTPPRSSQCVSAYPLKLKRPIKARGIDMHVSNLHHVS
ncbi:unnamed protein product, partial [Urochloa humidicola]